MVLIGDYRYHDTSCIMNMTAAYARAQRLSISVEQSVSSNGDWHRDDPQIRKEAPGDTAGRDTAANHRGNGCAARGDRWRGDDGGKDCRARRRWPVDRVSPL